MFQQTAERARAVIQCFVLGKALSHISAKLYPSVNQLQQATLLQWSAAKWRVVATSDGDHGGRRAVGTDQTTKTGAVTKIWKPPVNAGLRATKKSQAKGGKKRESQNVEEKTTVFSRKRKKIHFSRKYSKNVFFYNFFKKNL